MAEAGVPHPDGPRPEPPTSDGPGRPARTRGGRDPVALAAWRRVAEQRRRSTGGADDEHVEFPAELPVESSAGSPAGSPVEVGTGPDVATPVDVPEPALPDRRRSAEAAPVLRDEAAGAPREARPARPADASGPSVRGLPDDGPPAPGRLHEVLLGLAGRIDDDALTAVREMVAAEDDAEAAELLGGCLLADEVGLSPDERGVLGPWFASARVDPDLLAGLPVDPDALRRSGHRFVPTTAGAAPAAPLARAARRLSGVVAVRESWRVTPAGAAPGPVPHRVVLVETADPDDCDHVVHHLAHAARGLGDTSVEVFASGLPLPAYHRDALAAARPLTTADAAPTRAAVEAPRAQEVVREDGETWRTVADAGTARVVGQPPVLDRPAPAEPSGPVSSGAMSSGATSSGVVSSGPAPSDTASPGSTAAADTVPRGAHPAGPAAPVVGKEPETAEAERAADRPVDADGQQDAPSTSIDDDLSLTARRIAALWARPAPEDFSAPLPAESLEETRLEPPAGPDDGSEPMGAASVPESAESRDADRYADRYADSDADGYADRYDDVDDPAEEAGDLVDVDDREDTPGPVGRHGRGVEVDPGTDSFPSPLPRPAPRRNGHHLGDQPAARADGPGAPVEVDPGEPTPPDGVPAEDDAAAQVQRARHSRGRSEEPETPARSGHDARFGAGPGPAWPGAPVTGDRPGADQLFTSPVEIGEEPVTLGTNGHRHDAVTVVGPEEPATGPVTWSAAPVRPVNGVGHDEAAPPRPGGDVAPPWAASDGAGWSREPSGWSPPPAPSAGPSPVPPSYQQPPAATPEPEVTGAWAPETDDSVAQLSDRERELLARLHEELAQRERAEGADPFAGPTTGPAGGPPPQTPHAPHPPRPAAPPQPHRRNGHGPPPGRTNGHGLPGGPPDAS